MDSGNGHLAAIFGIPTVTLWGVTHPYAGFYPFGQAPENALLSDRETFPAIPTSVYGDKFPSGYEKAIAGIAPETIVRKVVAVMRRANTGS
jgi:ADP-heptose:LPS heptosyltransferase